MLIFGIYVGIGMYLNTKMFGKQGPDAFPNLEYWREVPILVKEGI